MLSSIASSKSSRSSSEAKIVGSILEYCSNTNWFRQYTFSVLREFKIGDEIQNIKTKAKGIVTEISDHTLVIKKSRFEIIIKGDECDEWEKKN